MPPTLFAFLDPFSGSLWVSIALAYVLVSITLFVVSRSGLYLNISIISIIFTIQPGQPSVNPPRLVLEVGGTSTKQAAMPGELKSPPTRGP